MVDGATAQQEVLGSIRRSGELESPSFEIFSSCLELLSWLSSVMACNLLDEMNTFLPPSYFWSALFIIATGNQARTSPFSLQKPSPGSCRER